MGSGEGRGVGLENPGSSSKDSNPKGEGGLVMEMAKVVVERQRVEVLGDAGREGKGSVCVVLDVMPDTGDDLKSGFECRICHLETVLEEAEGAELIQIGCGCKGELGTAHRHCAEAWFKLRGNRFCEICGVIAKNVSGKEDDRFLEDWNARIPSNFPSNEPEGSCWRDQPFCKFLIVCLVVAFILPWFFSVNMS